MTIFMAYQQGKSMSTINGHLKQFGMQHSIRNNKNSVSTSMEQIATGKKINSSTQNSSGSSIASSMRTMEKGTGQAIRNVMNAQSMLQVADGAMQALTDLLIRARELGIQASSPALSSQDRTSVEMELKEIRREIASIVTGTSFNDQKILSNRKKPEKVVLERSLERTFNLNTLNVNTPVQTRGNITGSASIGRESMQTVTQELIPTTNSITRSPQSTIVTTVLDSSPRWSTDGQRVVFQSTRTPDSAQAYAVPAGGGIPAVPGDGLTLAPRATQSPDGNLRLRFPSTAQGLLLERGTMGADGMVYQTIRSYPDYRNHANDPSPFSFSPVLNGNIASFAYTDIQGNIQQVDVNVLSGNPSAPVNLIHTDDRLDFSSINHQVQLSTVPNLVNMNTERSTFSIDKFNDNGARTLEYWDGTGSAPENGYYTVNDRTVAFFGEARIGGEAIDDASDYYQIFFSSDTNVGGDSFAVSLPDNVDIYNMDGSAGPRSLRISVGNQLVERADLLASAPGQNESVNGVYVNTSQRRVEFYGTFRPNSNESVTITYRPDERGENGLAEFSVPDNIDTYNLVDQDLSLNRALRVFVGNREVPYDTGSQQGYQYDRANGRILIAGDFRPDVHSRERVRIEYKQDTSGNNTSEEVFGIPVESLPILYNLDSSDPKSLRVYRNDVDEVPWSNQNGFQIGSDQQLIELYGSYRPDSTDTYSVYYLRTIDPQVQADGRVIVPLTTSPANYGVVDPAIPDTFNVFVNGQRIPYDPSQTNGFTYDVDNQRIEIFGNSRPNVTSPVDVGIALVNHARVIGSPAPTRETYDFPLQPPAEVYGLGEDTGPRSIRVYKDGQEVPYDSQSGFSFDSSTQIVSLHGAYRPTGDDAANAIRVAWVPPSALVADLPAGGSLTAVRLNGQAIPPHTPGSDGGYQIDGQQVRLVGDARPDARLNTTYAVQVDYFPGIQDLNLVDASIRSETSGYSQSLLSEENARRLPQSIAVFVNEQNLSNDDFIIQGNEILLTGISQTLTQMNEVRISIQYQAEYPTGRYGDSTFKFVTGTAAEQSFEMELASFDNLLFMLSDWSLPDSAAATRVQQDVDAALEFVSWERSRVGAAQNRLTAVGGLLSGYRINISSALSQIEDANYATASAELARSAILEQTSEAMLAQANQQQFLVLELLQGQEGQN
jgi:flagellin-like hook-associated protein FlgL